MSDALNNLAQKILTAEDFILYSESDEEISERCKVFCFDVEKFSKRLKRRERWQQLLQAHLYYDHVLTRMLSDALADPDAVNMRFMGFAQKLSLISAMGLIPKDIANAIEKINSLRNKIAHDLNFDITEKSVRDLANVTPKSVRDIAIHNDRKRKGPLNFDEIVKTLLILIEIMRQNRAELRARQRRDSVKLKVAMQNARHVLDGTTPE